MTNRISKLYADNDKKDKELLLLRTQIRNMESSNEDLSSYPLRWKSDEDVLSSSCRYQNQLRQDSSNIWNSRDSQNKSHPAQPSWRREKGIGVTKNVLRFERNDTNTKLFF